MLGAGKPGETATQPIRKTGCMVALKRSRHVCFRSCLALRCFSLRSSTTAPPRNHFLSFATEISLPFGSVCEGEGTHPFRMFCAL